ncbi:ADP-ribosylglycohydrolase family protein [Bacillus velezensis]|uniref:ADP-ribosylglycohydrolase family protein n=1 Tax=Bacillus velezensis TaxID=492670 RepID=UPI003EB70B1A
MDPGSYSDDTQLLFATARSLENKNWFSHFVKIELPTWLLYERGGGGATKRAADLWSNGHPPLEARKTKKDDIKCYFEAGGNGVTMRILPHVFNSFANPNEIFTPSVLKWYCNTWSSKSTAKCDPYTQKR